MLYTLSQPISHQILEQWLPLFTTADILLLTENGVISAIKNSQYSDLLSQISVQSIYALQQDIMARGLTQYIVPEVNIITDQQWIALTAEYYPQIVL